MGLLDRFPMRGGPLGDLLKQRRPSTAVAPPSLPVQAPPSNSYAGMFQQARQTWDSLRVREAAGDNSTELQLVKSLLERPMRASAMSLGVPDIGFKGVRQQLFQRFNLVDLYAIAHNNSVVKTATGVLKQEVFRRGMKWVPAFTYRDARTGEDYTLDRLKLLRDRDRPRYLRLKPYLVIPNVQQRLRFEQLMQNMNIYGQTLVRLLQAFEDDMNIADDGFLLLSSDYYLGWQQGEEVVRRIVRQVYRLDPVFVEFDTDQENRPGFAHHICLLHRDDLLTIPPDEDWHNEWKGVCPIDGHTTYPVFYRYAPYKGTFGMRSGLRGPDQQAMYFTAGEVVHASKFSPSELYGYSPILSIYEKALSLIGMDRYLYDYYFERQMPQGIVTTVTDNPEDLEVRKEQVLAEVLNNPHYIPWLAVSSKTGQGRTEFVRLAHSLDELQFLPVQQQIERSVSALYGIPGLFMGYEEGVGGLNNESQQIKRLSRGAQLSQDVYNTGVLPQLLLAFGITDWLLTLEDAEEQSEQFEVDMMQKRAQWASSMVQMGFGLKYDQDADAYEVSGEVKSAADQQEAQMEQQQAMMGGGGMGGGGLDAMLGGGASGGDAPDGGDEEPGGEEEPQEDDFDFDFDFPDEPEQEEGAGTSEKAGEGDDTSGPEAQKPSIVGDPEDHLFED